MGLVTPDTMMDLGGGCKFGVVDVTILLPDPKNTNVMPEPVYRQLVANIRDPAIGFLQPIAARPETDGRGGYTGRFYIVDGHHRVQAAREAGLTSVPVVSKDGMDASFASLVSVSMNNLHGQPDMEAIVAMFKDLHLNEGFAISDMTFTGFDEAAISKAIQLTMANPDMEMPQNGGATEGGNPEAKLHLLEIAFGDPSVLKKVKARMKKLRKDAGLNSDEELLVHILGLEARVKKN